MKKTYMNPEMNMSYFYEEDVVTTSGEPIQPQSGEQKLMTELSNYNIESKNIFQFTF